jgi:hypothetical protein
VDDLLKSVNTVTVTYPSYYVLLMKACEITATSAAHRSLVP